MGLRYFHRGQLRKASVAKARVLRRKGIEIIDTDQLKAEPAPEWAPTFDDPSLVEIRTEGGTVMSSNVEHDVEPENMAPPDPVDLPGVAQQQVADAIDERETAAAGRVRKCSVCGEPGHTEARCPLAELDALTTPTTTPES